MSREKAPNQTNTSYENTNESRFGWVKTATRKAVGTVALSGALFAGGAAIAHADNQLVFGGRYDVDSQELTQNLIDTHQINPVTDHIFAMKSPGGMIKQLDGTSMQDTVGVMMADADNTLATKVDRNERTNLWSYSLGTAGALLTADKHKGAINSVIADKSWLGPGGLGSSDLVKKPNIKAMLDENQIIANVPIPTEIPVRFISDTDDAISGGGHLDDVGDVINVGMSSFEGPHNKKDPSQQPREVQHYGNVTVEWFGDSPVPTFTLEPIQIPSLQDMLAQFQPPAPTPDAQPAPADVPPAPDAQPAPEAPVVLMSADAPAPEAQPAPQDAPAPEAAPAPAPEMAPAPVDDAPAPEAPAPDMDLAPAA